MGDPFRKSIRTYAVSTAATLKRLPVLHFSLIHLVYYAEADSLSIDEKVAEKWKPTFLRIQLCFTKAEKVPFHPGANNCSAHAQWNLRQTEQCAVDLYANWKGGLSAIQCTSVQNLAKWHIAKKVPFICKGTFSVYSPSLRFWPEVFN